MVHSVCGVLQTTLEHFANAENQLTKKGYLCAAASRAVTAGRRVRPTGQARGQGRYRLRPAAPSGGANRASPEGTIPEHPAPAPPPAEVLVAAG